MFSGDFGGTRSELEVFVGIWSDFVVFWGTFCGDFGGTGCEFGVFDGHLG